MKNSKRTTKQKTNANPQVSKKTKKENKKTKSNLPVSTEYMERASKMIEKALKEDKKKLKQAESQKAVVNQPSSIKTKMEIEFEAMQKENKAMVLQSESNLILMENLIPNVNGKELLNDELNEIPKLIDPIFHRVGLAALIGSSDTGKSSMLRDLCVSVVTGKKFLNWDVMPIHKRAYYVSTEDDKMAISYLLKKQNSDYGFTPEELEDLVYIFETDNLIKNLERELSQKPADVVVIDAFADVFTGQLYETNRVRAFLNDYSQLAQKYGCLIIFLHHTNKRSDNLEPSKHNALGSQGFEAKMRLMIELKSDNQSVNKKHFCIVKGNYLSHQFKTHSYELQFTENLTFNNLETRTHYDLLTQNKERRETIEYEYDEIMKLKQEGLTHEEIGLRLGVSKAGISRKISRYNKLKALEDSNQK
ncbi:MAG: AAA family ATPase [Bacilli bacterium]|nr:AAA family ATPase [Bacilli bacterium]